MSQSTELILPYSLLPEQRILVTTGASSAETIEHRSSVRKMAAGTAASAALTPLRRLVPPPFVEALGPWWAITMVNITVWAAATAHDKCFALIVGPIGSVTPASVGVTPEHYPVGCA